MCQLLSVSRNGYYEWRSSKPSARMLESQRLADRVRTIFTESRQTYGTR